MAKKHIYNNINNRSYCGRKLPAKAYLRIIKESEVCLKCHQRWNQEFNNEDSKARIMRLHNRRIILKRSGNNYTFILRTLVPDASRNKFIAYTWYTPFTREGMIALFEMFIMLEMGDQERIKINISDKVALTAILNREKSE